MKRTMRRVLACVIVMMLAMSALAATYPSKAFKLPGIKQRPTEQPTEAPAEPTAEPVEAPAADPTQAPEATPDDVPTTEPAVTPEAPEITGKAVVVLKHEGSTLNVRAGAGKDFECVAKLNHGDEVSVYGTSDQWAHILTADGVEGYVSAAYLQDSLPEEEPAVDPTEAPVEEPAVTALGDADVRLAPDGMSEIILTLPDGTPLNVVAVEGDWVEVAVDGQTGYIYKDSVAGVEFQQPELPEGEKPLPKVTIFTSRRSVMTPGETITLTSKLENFEEYSEVFFQWECDQGNGFEAVPGATEESYSFEATIETLSYSWRLAVSVNQ